MTLSEPSPKLSTLGDMSRGIVSLELLGTCCSTRRWTLASEVARQQRHASIRRSVPGTLDMPRSGRRQRAASPQQTQHTGRHFPVFMDEALSLIFILCLLPVRNEWPKALVGEFRCCQEPSSSPSTLIQSPSHGHFNILSGSTRGTPAVLLFFCSEFCLY